MKYYRVHIVNNHLNWRWEGVIHEHVECKEAKTSATLDGVINEVHVEGCRRSEEHTSELQSHSFISYAVFCLKKKK